MRNEPETGSARKCPQVRDTLPRPDNGYPMYIHMHEPPDPFWSNPRVAHQAPQLEMGLVKKRKLITGVSDENDDSDICRVVAQQTCCNYPLRIRLHLRITKVTCMESTLPFRSLRGCISQFSTLVDALLESSTSYSSSSLPASVSTSSAFLPLVFTASIVFSFRYLINITIHITVPFCSIRPGV